MNPDPSPVSAPEDQPRESEDEATARESEDEATASESEDEATATSTHLETATAEEPPAPDVPTEQPPLDPAPPHMALSEVSVSEDDSGDPEPRRSMSFDRVRASAVHLARSEQVRMMLGFAWRTIVLLIPKANYFWGHLIYIIFMSLLGGLILWGLEDGIWYLDSLFVAASAVCVTGLSTVDFSVFSVSGQVLVLVWIQFGGLIMLSMAAPIARLIFHYRTKDPRDGFEVMSPQTVRILKIVIATIVSYLVVVQLLAFIILGAYLSADDAANAVMKANGVHNPWWWALFYTMSAFQNAGFALMSSSIVPFSNDRLVSLVIAFLIMAGNTLYPIFFRAILVSIKKLTCNERLRNDLEELLQNPRSYYYLLFPSFNTWILLGCWSLLTLVEWSIFFVEWDRLAVYGADFSSGIKLMINFVQTVSVRTCGLNNVNIGSLTSGHLAFLMVSMFLSAFPFMVSLRTSSAERKSDPAARAAKFSKRLLARDIIWVYLAIIIITFVEGGRPSTDPAVVLNSFLFICFEVVSAFGTVGLSVGFPGQNYSYCGSFHGVSKFIILLTLIAGRHRGLPESIDFAVTSVRRSFSLDMQREKREEFPVSAQSSSSHDP